eukprot:COSAG06_NODE_31548_length_519_cov_5.933333_1_plen_69_part_01
MTFAVVRTVLHAVVQHAPPAEAKPSQDKTRQDRTRQDRTRISRQIAKVLSEASKGNDKRTSVCVSVCVL